MVMWNKTEKIRNPQTKRKIRRARPKSDWIRMELPEQRIIPEKLWLAVEDRLAYVNRVFGARGRKGGLMNARAASSPYIFSGLLRCGVCGSNYTLISDSGRNHTARYGCPSHTFRGTCKNARSVSLDVLENELLAKLQRDVLSDAAIDYCLERLEEEIEKRESAIDSTMRAVDERKAKLETEIENLSRVLAAGGPDSPALRKAVTDREQEISELTGKILGRKKGSVRKQMIDLRKFVKSSLGDIRELLAGKHGNPAILKRHLAEHIGAITLLPDGTRDIQYKGQWRLLGKKTEDAEGQS